VRVGIGLLTLVPGISGGSETYARELTAALHRVGSLDYVVLASTLADTAGGGLPTEVATAYRASLRIPGRLAAMGRASLRPRPLERLLGHLDAFHYPLTVPIPRTALPHAVTLHDVQHLDLPRLFPRGELAFRRLAYDRAARRADVVIVLSEFVRERAAARLRLDPDRMRVVPLGIDHDRFHPGGGERRELLLYPARPWPHKNHPRLLDAFAVLRERRPGLELVLTGYERAVPPGVRALARVSADDLAELYRSAAALVFPSLYEGFGQPPLEAMACGCPVACSTSGSLPEVCGDAARFFDPASVEDLVAAVEDVLDDPEPWRVRGLRRAAEFTWEATARAHDAVYRGLL
jgi:glycosyltransferase involved in cell wall biosynthesis